MEKQVFPITRGEAKKQGIAFSSENNKNTLFPSRLRDLRDEKKVSQAVLAETLKVSKSTVGLWEAGETLPDAKALHDMAVYFGVSADYILCLSDTGNSDMDFRAVCEFTGLSEEAVKNILTLKYLSARTRKNKNLLFSARELQEIFYQMANAADTAIIFRESLEVEDPDYLIEGHEGDEFAFDRYKVIKTFESFLDRVLHTKEMEDKFFSRLKERAEQWRT